MRGSLKRSSRSPTAMDEVVEDEECEYPRDRSPGYPYIEFGARACYKEEVSLTKGSSA